MITIYEYVIWASSTALGIACGLLWGYLMCLRNHKLIKGEETMWDKNITKNKEKTK